MRSSSIKPGAGSVRGLRDPETAGKQICVELLYYIHNKGCLPQFRKDLREHALANQDHWAQIQSLCDFDPAPNSAPQWYSDPMEWAFAVLPKVQRIANLRLAIRGHAIFAKKYQNRL